MSDKVRTLAVAAAFVTFFFMALYETSFNEVTAEDLFVARDRIISEYCSGGANLQETEEKLKRIEMGRALTCDLEQLENRNNFDKAEKGNRQESKESVRYLTTYVKNSRPELEYLEYRVSELTAAFFVNRDGKILVKEKKYRIVIKDDCGITKISQIM